MEFTEVVRRRRMVRNYSSEPVDRSVLDRILEGALRSPSAGFSQGWAFLVLDRKEDVDRFWEVTTSPGELPDSWLRGMTTAPVLIIPCSSKAAYLQRYGDVSAELRLEDRLINLVEDGIDLAVRIGFLADSSLVARHVGEMRRIVVASPGYLKRHGEPKRPADITGHQTIQFGASAATGEWRFVEEDREFLKRGEVFSDDLIDSYIDLKWEEQYAFEHTPHPIEFKMYYSV